MRILIADEQALFRAGLCYLLGQLGDRPEILEAGFYDDLISTIRRNDDLDLLLVDLLLPGLETFLRLQELCGIAARVPVVVISVRDRASDVQQAIKVGASGYIPKSSSPDVMIGALKLVLSGGIYIPPNVLSLADPIDTRRSSGQRATGGGTSSGRLTRRQREVLALLAQGKSNKEIAEELGLASGTVKIHIANIFKTLKVHNRIQAILAAGELVEGQQGKRGAPYSPAVPFSSLRGSSEV